MLDFLRGANGGLIALPLQAALTPPKDCPCSHPPHCVTIPEEKQAARALPNTRMGVHEEKAAQPFHSSLRGRAGLVVVDYLGGH